MAKRNYKKEIAADLCKHTREWKKKMFQEVLEKGTVGTLRDICAVFYGLSKSTRDNIVFNRIYELARCGYTTQEIVNRLEVNK